MYDVNMTNRIDRINWERAVLTNERGTLGKVITLEKVRVPSRIEVHGEYLVWNDADYSEVTVGDNLLDDFVKLADTDSSSEKIAAFARRHGVLGVCGHYADESLLPPPYQFDASPQLKLDCPPFDSEAVFHWEPLETWRHLAREALALINISAQLLQGMPAKTEDWLFAFDWYEDIFLEESETFGDVDGDKMVLVGHVNAWVKAAGVFPILSFQAKKGFDVALASEHGFLLGPLAMNLMFAVSRTDGPAKCSSCGELYAPDRRPKAKQRNYCSKCRKTGAPQRDASREYRRRLRGES